MRAEILCAALRTQQYLNDFGYLHPTEHSSDGESARALLETGDAARPCLARLLDDRDPAPLFGSEAATIADMYRFRRRDFAYHYLSRILGSRPRNSIPIRCSRSADRRLEEASGAALMKRSPQAAGVPRARGATRTARPAQRSAAGDTRVAEPVGPIDDVYSAKPSVSPTPSCGWG